MHPECILTSYYLERIVANLLALTTHPFFVKTPLDVEQPFLINTDVINTRYGHKWEWFSTLLPLRKRCPCYIKKKPIEALSRSIHMCYCLQSSLLIATLLKSLPEKKMDVWLVQTEKGETRKRHCVTCFNSEPVCYDVWVRGEGNSLYWGKARAHIRKHVQYYPPGTKWTLCVSICVLCPA